MNLSRANHTPYESRILSLHQELGIPRDYFRRGFTIQPEVEPLELVTQPLGRYGEPIRVSQVGLQAWEKLRAAAAEAGIELCISHGFRSVDEQADIIRRALNSGDSIQDLLRQFVAPGYSEHHTGRAFDVSMDPEEGMPFADEFERTSTFKWLVANGPQYGFIMTYPRNNSYGIIYEPWHWMYLI